MTTHKQREAAQRLGAVLPPTFFGKCVAALGFGVAHLGASILYMHPATETAGAAINASIGQAAMMYVDSQKRSV